MNFWLGLLATAGCLVFAGCAPQQIGIHGQVTLQGKPLDEAVVQFVPLAKGKINGSEIKAGNYSLEASRGLLPGKYRVEIKDNPPLAAGHNPNSFAKRRILPEKYSQDSKFEIEIPADAPEPLKFDFKL